MKNKNFYKNKKILILGFGYTGLSLFKLLFKLDAILFIYDDNDNNKNYKEIKKIKKKKNVKFYFKKFDFLNKNIDLIFKSPGITYNNIIIKNALKYKIPIFTDIELIYQLTENFVIAVTGSNGKTTIMSLLNLLINNKFNKKKNIVFSCGNIGYPISNIILKIKKKDLILLELSSFQLLGIKKFKPNIAIIINIFEAHLDYHKNFKEYIFAKWRIQKNMFNNDILILNWDNYIIRKLSKSTNAFIIPFSVNKILNNGAYLKNNKIYFKNEFILNINNLLIIGIHNISNILAAIIVAKLRNISLYIIREILFNFCGIKHRLQYVCTINKRKFYNDSKSTNNFSTKVAINSFKNKKKIILLAGGLDRNYKFEKFIYIFKKIKALISFGETKNKIYFAGKKANILVFKTFELKEAVLKAYKISDIYDIILFSPMCASWDQFENFIVRGNMFIKILNKIKNIKVCDNK